MDLAEAKSKKKAAAQKMGEFIAENFCAKEGDIFDPANLPGIGISPTSGRRKFAITLHIANKQDKSNIRPLIRELGLSNDSVDVHITGVASAWSYYHRPLATGVSISHDQTGSLTSGTLGCFVRKCNQPNELFILSCAHVLLPPQYWAAGLDQGNGTHRIVQPAIADAGEVSYNWVADHWIADLREAVPLRFSDPDTELSYNYQEESEGEELEEPIDAAIAVIRSSLRNDCLSNISHLLNGEYRTNEDIINMGSRLNNFPVFKIGKQTKLKAGKIAGIELERYLKRKNINN